MDIIKLYESVDHPVYLGSSGAGSAFKGNFIAAITGFSTAKVKEEINGVYTFEGEYVATEPYANQLRVGRLIECYTTTKRGSGIYPQLFRITSVKKNTTSKIKITGEHISYDMAKYLVCPMAVEYNATTGDPERKTFSQLVAWIEGYDDGAGWEDGHVYGYESNTERERALPFVFGTSGNYGSVAKDVNFTALYSLREWIGDSEYGILKTFGGEVSYNNENIIFQTRRGSYKNYTILYGKNIKDYTHTVDGTSIFGAILPYYKLTVSDGTGRSCVWGFEESEYRTPGGQPIYPVLDPDPQNPWGYLDQYLVEAPFISVDSGAQPTPINRAKAIAVDLTSEIDYNIRQHHENDADFQDVSSWNDIIVTTADIPTAQDTPEVVAQKKARREVKRQWRNRFIAEAIDAYVQNHTFDYTTDITIDFQSLYSPENSVAAEDIELGDTVYASYAPLGWEIRKRITAITYDVLKGRYDKIELKDRDTDITSVIANTAMSAADNSDAVISKSASFESDVKSLIDKYRAEYLVSASVSGNTLTIVPSSGESVVFSPAQTTDTWRNIYLNNQEFLTNAATSGHLKFTSSADDTSGRMGLSIDGSSETGGKKLDFGLYYDLSYFTRDNDYDYLTLNSTWLNSMATKSYVTWNNVDGKPSTFPPSAHTHVVFEHDEEDADGANGFVPKPTYQQYLDNKFLRSDGTWNYPSWTTLLDKPTISTYSFQEGSTDGAFQYKVNNGNWQTVPIHNAATISYVNEKAAGLSAAYVINTSSSVNPAFNVQDSSITVTNFVTTSGETVSFSDLKVGDTIYVTNSEVPDRWVGSVTLSNATLYTLETVKPAITDVKFDSTSLLNSSTRVATLNGGSGIQFNTSSKSISVLIDTDTMEYVDEDNKIGVKDNGHSHLWANISDHPSIPTNTSDLTNDGSDGTSTYLEADETAYETASIPFGRCNPEPYSTSTAFTATVPGITELRDGVCMLLKNGVVTSASGFTINVNGLGAKPVYNNMAAATRDTTIFNVNYTMLFIYDETRTDGGCWICYRGYNSDTNTIAYQVRTNSTVLPTSDTCRYYKIFFTSADGTQWVPASADSTNSSTSAKTVNQRPINPFGDIVYTSATTKYSAGGDVAATTLWRQYNLTLGYSFNRTGVELALVTKNPVYIKCAPQSNGSAIIDSTTPYVQALPSTEDGKIYIFLGIATSATAVELTMHHPIYYYKDGAIREWTNCYIPTEIGDLNYPNAQGDEGKVPVLVSTPGGIDVAWQKIKFSEIDNTPTTLAGYGISDAKIENGTITLGSNTITPLTSHQTVTANNPTLDWGTQSTIGSVGGTAFKVTMPSNPLTFPPQASDENKVIKYAGMDAYTWDFVAWGEITGKPTFATVATSGSYNDLLNKPSLGTLSSATPSGTDGYLYYDETEDSYEWRDIGWSDVNNKPNFATVATSGSYNDLLNKPTLGALASLNSISYTSNYITNKPSLGSLASATPSGTDGYLYYDETEDAYEWKAISYSDLTNRPTLGALAALDSISYTSNYITNKPTLGALAALNSISYTSNYITNKPSLGSLASATPSGTYGYLYYDNSEDAYEWRTITIPTVNDATLTIQKNGTSVGTFTANASTNKSINITVPTSAADVSALPASTKYGASISVSINATDYKVTTTLKDQDGNTLGTAQVIDLPLESVVVNGSYDSTNRKIVLTLQNGSTIDIPVGDLISGLQSEITSSNKLDADLVDDSTSTHKFTTASDKTKLAGIASGAQVNVIETVKVNGTALTVTNKAVNVTVPTAVSSLTNDSGFITRSGISATSPVTYNSTTGKIGIGYSAPITVTSSNLTLAYESASLDLNDGNLYVKDNGHSHTWSNISDHADGVNTDLGINTSTGSTTQFLTRKGTWATPAGTYSLPLAANGTRGGIQIGYTQSGKNYPVQLSSEKAYVNVPWTDTTYSGTGEILLSGTTFYHNTHLSGTSSTAALYKVGLNDYGHVVNYESVIADDIPDLPASKITSGTFADARIASASIWNAKYTKPSGGIPASDLAESYYLASNPSGYTSNAGTVTSVAASGSGGISVSGSPITSSGTLAIGLNLSTAINGLGAGTAASKPNDYLVSQYVGGGTTNTTYYRRPVYMVVQGVLGYTTNGNKYAVEMDSTTGSSNLRKLYVNVPWENTTYSLSVGTGADDQKIILTPSSGANPDKITVPYATAAGSAGSANTATSAAQAAILYDPDGPTPITLGGPNQPIWFNGGVPALCGYALNKTVPSNAVFTDTTYTFASGTNGFTVTPAGGTAQTVTVTPSIANNVTGSGTSGYLAKWNGANTLTDAVQYSTSASDSTVVQRANGGYIYASLYNTTVSAGNPANYTNPCVAWIDSSGWIRKASKADFGAWISSDVGPYEANLKWGGKNFAASYGPIDAAMIGSLGANRFELLKVGTAQDPGIETFYSRDGGSTWTDYGHTDAQKRNLFNSSTTSSLIIGQRANGDTKSVDDRAKLIIHTGAAGVYTALNKFAIYVGTNGSSHCWVTIDKCIQNKDTSVESNWENVVTKISVNGWSGWNIINPSSSITTYGNSAGSQYGHLRFIFGADTAGGTSYTGLNIQTIMGFGGVGWSTPSQLAKNGHAYTWDYAGNVTFQAAVTARGNLIADNRGGTTTTTGATEVIVGNSIATGTNGNSRGYLRLYGSGSGYATLAYDHSGATNTTYYLYPQSSSQYIATANASGITSGALAKFDSTTGHLVSVTVGAGLDLSNNNVVSVTNPLTFPEQATDENKVIKYAGMDAYTWDFVAWSEITGKPTVPTITLNGSTTTTPSFFAPTGAGSSGSILRSDGPGNDPVWIDSTSLRRPFSYISASGEQEVDISRSNKIVLAAGTNISLNKSEATNKTTITFNVSASPTPDPPAPCLIEGTQIKMADGSTKAIEDVKTGDEILSWDVNANTFTTAFVISQSCNGRSLEFMSHLFDDGSYIVTYGVHMVYNATKGYPIDISEFNIGDTTINADGDVISYIGNNRYRVRRKDSVNYYALTTSNNLYFAGDILNGMTVFAKYRAADKLGLDIPDSLKLVCQEQEKIIDDAAGFQKSDAYLREISAALKQKSILTKRINEAKAYLDKTDYYDNKYVERALSEEEWAKTVANRATMRSTINDAEPDLAAAESQIKSIQAKYYKSTKGKRSRFKSFCALDNANLDIYRAWLQKGDPNEK